MTLGTSEVLLDPYDYDFHEDPYPYYKRLRDEAPLYHNEELGFWALSRHQDVREGFRNSTTLSNREGVSLDPVSRGPHASKTMSFLAMDDPDHLRLRTLVSKGFTPRRIRELEPRITELAKQHLDTMLERADSGTVDYVAEFAGKLADGCDLRADGRTRRGSRPHPGARRRRDAPRGRRQRCARLRDRGVDQPVRLLPGDDRRPPQEAVGRPDVGAPGGRDRRRPADRRRGPRLPVPDGDRRQRDHHQTACQCGVLGPPQSRPAGAAVPGSGQDSVVGRGDAALRHVQPAPGAGRLRRAETLRHHDPRRRHPAAAARLGASRRAGVRRTRTTT